jgi:hypothetical protein
VLKALLLILQRLKRDEVSLQIVTTQSKMLKTPCAKWHFVLKALVLNSTFLWG